MTKVRVVGMNSIKKELASVGIDSVGGEDFEGYDNGRIISLNEFDEY